MSPRSYASHSFHSDPGSLRGEVARWPADPVAIARRASSLVQHPRGRESRAVGFGAIQRRDLELRSVAELLQAAKERGLLADRAGAPKLGGTCRDFALLAVASFRERGVPARLRVGFADYIISGRREDHWLCEWWDAGRWRRFDVEFAVMDGLPFDACDVPAGRFLCAAEAWRQIALEPGRADDFGVSGLSLGGARFVAGSLFRDLACLRKLELKPWDYWGAAARLPVDPAEWPVPTRRLLDEIASCLNASCIGEPAMADCLTRWALPVKVTSFPHGRPVEVRLATA